MPPAAPIAVRELAWISGQLRAARWAPRGGQRGGYRGGFRGGAVDQAPGEATVATPIKKIVINKGSKSSQ